MYARGRTASDYQDNRLNAVICLLDGDGRRYQVGELSGDFDLYTDNFCDYLSVLGRKNYTVFLTVMDEGTYSLNEPGRSKLKNLGLQIDLKDQNRSSYFAVIDGGRVTSEEISQERISEEGVLYDGKTSYGIMSSGFNAGSDCSVRINGTEYAVKGRGINIVVYDPAAEKVLDSVCFDTYTGMSVTRNGSTVETSIFQEK